MVPETVYRLKENSALVLKIYVDADACPVKPEIYRVARRYGLKVVLVSNSWMRTPEASWLELVVVDSGPDAADAWIVEQVREDDIVITGDIPLASECLKKGTRVIGNTGRPFTEINIGNILATRNLFTDLRDQGIMTRGPAPFDRKDRSRFLQILDQTVNAIMRKH